MNYFKYFYGQNVDFLHYFLRTKRVYFLDDLIVAFKNGVSKDKTWVFIKYFFKDKMWIFLRIFRSILEEPWLIEVSILWRTKGLFCPWLFERSNECFSYFLKDQMLIFPKIFQGLNVGFSKYFFKDWNWGFEAFSQEITKSFGVFFLNDQTWIFPFSTGLKEDHSVYFSMDKGGFIYSIF